MNPPTSPAQTSRTRLPDRTFDPLTGLAAVALPGLGHFFLGERARATHIAAGIAFLLLAGLLIGGIGAVDSQANPGWFISQAFLGPIAFLIDTVHQTRFAAPGVGTQALGRAEEIGILYVAVAGLLNLIAVLDATFPRAATPAKAKETKP